MFFYNFLKSRNLIPKSITKWLLKRCFLKRSNMFLVNQNYFVYLVISLNVSQRTSGLLILKLCEIIYWINTVKYFGKKHVSCLDIWWGPESVSAYTIRQYLLVCKYFVCTTIVNFQINIVYRHKIMIRKKNSQNIFGTRPQFWNGTL